MFLGNPLDQKASKTKNLGLKLSHSNNEIKLICLRPKQPYASSNIPIVYFRKLIFDGKL